jgi:hypothetical protein
MREIVNIFQLWLNVFIFFSSGSGDVKTFCVMLSPIDGDRLLLLARLRHKSLKADEVPIVNVGLFDVFMIVCV